jgi:hypothetical protein
VIEGFARDEEEEFGDVKGKGMVVMVLEFEAL